MAFPTGWQRVCPITIPAAQVAGSLTNFPIVLTAVWLPSEMVTTGATYAAQANGGDIRFSSDFGGQSELSCEIVNFAQNSNPSNAVVEIHVNGTSLSSSVANTIYVWYAYLGGGQSQPAASGSYGSQSVWDANYMAVWHFGTAASLALTDSTANAKSLTNNSCTAGSGVMGGALVCPGSGDYADVVLSGTALTQLTIEMWFYITTTPSGQVGVMCWERTGLPIDGFPFVYFGLTSSDVTEWLFNAGYISSQASSTGTWYHVALTWTNSTGLVTWYLNGVSKGTYTSTIPPNQQSYGNEVYLGSGYTGQLTGRLDEVRLSSTQRSGAWIQTVYNNQVPGSTFASAGTPVFVGTQTITVPSKALHITGVVPTVAVGRFITVPSATLHITGHAPTVNQTIAVPATTLHITGHAPTVNQTIVVPGAALHITGQAPTVLNQPPPSKWPRVRSR
jgi:hypothetical protein